MDPNEFRKLNGRDFMKLDEYDIYEIFKKALEEKLEKIRRIMPESYKENYKDEEKIKESEEKTKAKEELKENITYSVKHNEWNKWS